MKPEVTFGFILPLELSFGEKKISQKTFHQFKTTQ